MIINDPTVTLGGTIDLTTTLTATTKDLIIAAGGATLSGGGTLLLTNLATNTVVGADSGATLTNDDKIKGAGQLGDGTMTLDNAAGALIEGTGSVALTINTGGNHDHQRRDHPGRRRGRGDHLQRARQHRRADRQPRDPRPSRAR